MTGTKAINALIALFEREGYARTEPAVLQPADAFIDLSGEDIRRRMFVTQDASGVELCLRPEYTIPVCLQHLAEQRGAPASYSYGGPVFRLRTGESGEFLQAGIESIGRADSGRRRCRDPRARPRGPRSARRSRRTGCASAIWGSSTP